jgi:hypothetical protein
MTDAKGGREGGREGEPIKADSGNESLSYNKSIPIHSLKLTNSPKPKQNPNPQIK